MRTRAAPGRSIVCHAEGTAGRWEAYCLTFDLAVHGKSFEEVRRKISEQVELYIEGVNAQPESERERLLRRRAPLGMRLWLLGNALLAALGRHDPKERRRFRLPLGDVPAV